MTITRGSRDDAGRHPHRFAPWTLVDFNDQPRGRLTLIRDLLDRVPDTELPLAEIPWPRLGHPPLKEHFGVLQPIEGYGAPPRRTRGQATSSPLSSQEEG